MPMNESTPLEEVVFIRDEMANLAWGIERIAAGLSGPPVDRREVYLEQQRRRAQEQPVTPAVSADALPYRLMSTVSDDWIPFLPVRPDLVSPQIHLRRGAMAGPDGTAAPSMRKAGSCCPSPVHH
ncbi:MAG: hypothetical protein AB7N91_20530 [Candidatus Tectimicrobiota bacterium]